MNVGVDEARQYQVAAGVPDAGSPTNPGTHSVALANKDDAAALYRHRRGHATRRIGRVDAGIDNDQIGVAGRSCRRNAKASYRQSRNCQ